MRAMQHARLLLASCLIYAWELPPHLYNMYCNVDQ